MSGALLAPHHTGLWLGFSAASFTATLFAMIYPFDAFLTSPRKHWLRDVATFGAWPSGYTPGDFIPGYAWLWQPNVAPSLFMPPDVGTGILQTVTGVPLLAYFSARFGPLRALALFMFTGASAVAGQQFLGWHTEDCLEKGGFNRGLVKDRYVASTGALTGLGACYTLLYFISDNIASRLPVRVPGATMQVSSAAMIGASIWMMVFGCYANTSRKYTSERNKAAFRDFGDDYNGQVLPASPMGGIVGGIVAALAIRRGHFANLRRGTQSLKDGVFTSKGKWASNKRPFGGKPAL